LLCWRRACTVASSSSASSTQAEVTGNLRQFGAPAPRFRKRKGASATAEALTTNRAGRRNGMQTRSRSQPTPRTMGKETGPASKRLDSRRPNDRKKGPTIYQRGIADRLQEPSLLAEWTRGIGTFLTADRVERIANGNYESGACRRRRVKNRQGRRLPLHLEGKPPAPSQGASAVSDGRLKTGSAASLPSYFATGPAQWRKSGPADCYRREALPTGPGAERILTDAVSAPIGAFPKGVSRGLRVESMKMTILRTSPRRRTGPA